MDLWFYDGVDNLWIENTTQYEIEDIEFITSDVVLTNETVNILGSIDLQNMSNTDLVKPAKFEREFTGSYHFAHQTGLQLKDEDRLQKGIPL